MPSSNTSAGTGGGDDVAPAPPASAAVDVSGGVHLPPDLILQGTTMPSSAHTRPKAKAKAGTGGEDDVEPAPLTAAIADVGGGTPLPSELTLHVSTFLAIPNDDSLWNMCLAVGPEDSRAIRNWHLKDNTKYLQRTLAGFHCKAWCKAKARRNHLAWMEVNTDWRANITAQGMDDLREATTDRFRIRGELEGGPHFTQHPFLAFNNPAIAIQLGLLDVLKCLVEEKDIIINPRQWVGYFVEGSLDHLPSWTRRLPLTAYCAGFCRHAHWEGDLDAHQYLLGLPSFVIKRHFNLFPEYFLFPSTSCAALPFLRLLTEHQDFSKYANENIIRHPSGSWDFAPYWHSSTLRATPMLLVLSALLHNMQERNGFDEEKCRNVYEGLEMILKAGADPSHPIAGPYCALELWEKLRNDLPTYNKTAPAASEECRQVFWDKVSSLLKFYHCAIVPS